MVIEWTRKVPRQEQEKNNFQFDDDAPGETAKNRNHIVSQ